MNLGALSDFKHCLILLLLISVQQLECRRGGGGRRTGGGRHTTPRSHNYNTHNSGTGSNADHQDRVHQTNVYQTNNHNPVTPSAPIAPPSSNTNNIGFEHFNQQHGSQANRQDIGFENVHNRVPPQNNQPGSSIGFNVPQQNHPPQGSSGGFNVPQQNHQQPPATAFNVPQQNYQPSHSPPNVGGGFPPQTGYQNPNYPHTNSYPGASNYPQMNTGNYYPNNYNQFGGNNGFNPHLQGGGYHNPNLAQPGSYYNPSYGIPGGVSPPIYQPVQQSSGSSFLGYAGSFAGGYLIGKLTSGGHDSSNTYTVHHYHHNSDAIPKKTSVSNTSLATCSQNETQGLCVPNTFPICLVNGTIMCVTHTPYTVPCGSNHSMSCIITVLPCANGTNCNNTGDTTTAVYIPCISNATVAKPTELQNMALPSVNGTTNQTASNSTVELCITAIAEPQKLVAPKMESPAMSYFNVIEKILELPFDANNSTEMSIGNVQNVTSNNSSDVIYVTS